MITLLRKIFIKNYQNVKNPTVREAHGKLASFVGVFSNMLLFIIKLVAGLLANSIAILADSINNLSDMGSSVITLVGFKLASIPADKEHPYGHERMEYIAGLIVSIIIMFVGGSLFITSIQKIIGYEKQTIANTTIYLSIVILVISIILKIWQSFFNKKIGKIINSVALEATAADSRNDVIATSVILIGQIVLLFYKDMSFSLDGVLGVLVSIFIIISGIKLIKDTMNPLIGVSSESQFAEQIINAVKNYSDILGVHDVVCHMYGPTKCFMTLHAEVNCKADFITVHDQIDTIEKDIKEKFGVELTIHMDPIEIDNPVTNELKEEVRKCLFELDHELKFHDFRVVRKLSQSTILFDIVIPYKYKLSNEAIINYISETINNGQKKYAFIIEFDHHFIKDDEN